MKIAFIGQKGIPVTFGGVEYHVDKLSREMASLDHKVTAYVRNWYTDRKIKNHHGVRLIHIPTIRGKHLDASVHSLLCSVHALFKKYDIIHYHGIGPAFFSLIPSLFRKNVVTTIHRLDWETEKWKKWAKRTLKWGEYVSVKIPKRTIVISTELKKYIKEKHGKETIFISHGIAIPEPVPPALIKDKYGLDGKDYILFMGRLSPEKRVDWLINAFQSLDLTTADGRNLKLVVAGGSSATPEYSQRLQDMAKDTPDVIFTGYVTGVEKAEFFSNALLFSLPSSLEGFPIVLLEAKSYGICCLVSDIPPHRELFNSGIDGMLFKSDSRTDLCARLEMLIKDPQNTERLGKQAKVTLQQIPDWREVAERTLDIYRDIL
jgi:glycosyltransferase involved in cell wall biosynthesis